MKSYKILGLIFWGLCLLVTSTACQFPSRTVRDRNLVGVWQESGRIEEDGEALAPNDPLLIGFFSDGTFKAVFSSHRFETYHDFWGEWETNEGALTLIITDGNELPALSAYEGTYEINDQELKVEGIPLLDGSERQVLVFSYQDAPPKDRIIP